MQSSDHVLVEPYNPSWPALFEAESKRIQEALGAHCVAIHHVGSTAVPGLPAKSKIDIIGVVNDLKFPHESLEALGYKYRGGFSIPLRKSFTIRQPDFSVNLHIFEDKDPEIDLNLRFRDYLRGHPEVRDRYAALKYQLVAEESSHKKQGSMYKGYTLGKHEFIEGVLRAVGFSGLRFVISTHHKEWDAVKAFRKKYFFDPISIEDPYTWTFDHPDHVHLVLYEGVDIVGYTHIQLWPNNRAAMRIIVIDEARRGQQLGRQFLGLCEKWLRLEGCRSLHVEARKDVVGFYKNNGYIAMPFNDPDGHPSDPQDVPLGKVFCSK